MSGKAISDNSVAVCSNAVSFLSEREDVVPGQHRHGYRAATLPVFRTELILWHGMRALRKPCAAWFGLQLGAGMLTSDPDCKGEAARMNPKQG
ncbi:MAG: hypothetical protein HoeaKO_18660 [Hoeflea alexandrii]|jgi:hypothetical protein